jgi:hypothetical protein
MVYLDYEAGSSTRIDQIRSNKVTNQLMPGGIFNYNFTLATTGISFFYFYSKFKGENYGALGALFLSVAFGRIVYDLGKTNFGLFYEKYYYYRINKNMIDIQNDDFREIADRREKQKQKIIDNMGKV